jgi:hypothetical protein
MKIKDVISETTTSGSIAPSVTTSTATIKRGGNLLTGKKTKQKYANSVKKPVVENNLKEQDLIVTRGMQDVTKNLFNKDDDHDVAMARSDLIAAVKNAKSIYQCMKDKDESEGVEGWVQEKLIKANDYLNAVKEYYDEKKMRHDSGMLEGKSENAWNAGMSDKDFIEKFGKDEFDRLKKKYGHGSIPVPDLVGYKPRKPEDRKVRLHRGLEGPGEHLRSIIKKQGVSEGQVDEVNRRGFIRGMAGAAALGGAGIGMMSEPSKDHPILSNIQQQLNVARKNQDQKQMMILQRDYKRAKDSIETDSGIPSDILSKYKNINEGNDDFHHAVDQSERIVKRYVNHDLHIDIISKIENLASQYDLSPRAKRDLEYRVSQIFEKQKELESSIYGLADVFKDELYTKSRDLDESKKKDNKYAIGMAAAKKAAGYGEKPAHDLPKSVIKKAHKIAKKIS